MSGGGSIGSSDSRFERTGDVNTSSWRDLTKHQHGLFDRAFHSVRPDNLSHLTQGKLNARMNRTFNSIPFQTELGGVLGANAPRQSLFGQKSLNAQAGVNPYSKDYADNTFDQYADEVHRAMAGARSGPMATRGGTAAQGFAQSDAVNQLSLNRQQNLTQNRQADANIQQGASSNLAGQFGQRSQTSLGGINTGWDSFYKLLNDRSNAAQLATERNKMFNDLVPTFTSLASVMKGREQNELEGRGAQTSSSMGAGVNVCCFIFLEAYNGELPVSVRRYRDEFAPENSARRKGYIRMSRWLVPAMRTSRVVRTLVNCLLVRPLTKYGEWYYSTKGFGWVFKPVRNAWFKVWEKLGTTNN